MDILLPLAWLAAAIYAVAVVLLAVYGAHSLWLLALFLRNRRAAAAQEAAEAARPLPGDGELPAVLVQLPVFNERDVVCRLVEAAGALDWPRERLIIQLLDDSTDDSVEVGRAAIAALAARGLRAELVHRTDRTGFKAGALEHGMARHPDAGFIAIFDADFVPAPDFLRRAIAPLLADPGLGLVQGRWGHLNRDDNLLTRAQAVGIDGHFAIEQGARAWSGLAMNFNGTCGLWRRAAIAAAGGWEHDTLTEDMDLSYRAQLKGWRCTYRLGLAVPGEIPASVSAWRSQQFRWAKGSIQTARKLLPGVWRSSWNWREKLGATLHMTHYLVHPLILASLFSAPLALWLVGQGEVPMWVLMFGLAGFLVGASAPIAVYVASQLVLQGRAGLANLKALPALAAIGTGIAVSNAQAVWQALRGKQSEFVRTPKQGAKAAGSYRASPHSGMPELFCAAWALVGISVGFIGHHTWVTPLLALYLSGFAWMAVACMRERYGRAQAAPAASPLPLLLPLGLLLIATLAALGLLAGGWRAQPLTATALALVAGALYIGAALVVARRPGGRSTLAWILVVAVALRLACLALPTAPEVGAASGAIRFAQTGGNPYLVEGAPAPAALGFASLVGAFSPSSSAFQVAGLCAELIALGLILALVVRFALPAGWILLAAWNPLPALLLSGEGQLAAAGLLLLALAMYLAGGGHQRRSLAVATLAALVKPPLAVALIPQLPGSRLRLWLVPAAVLAFCALPFIDVLPAVAASLQVAGGECPGPLAMVIAPALGGLGATATACLLAGAWLAMVGVLLRRHLLQADERAIPALVARLLAITALCLPAHGLWLVAGVALLLPFVRSLALAVWTVSAPLWWLSAGLVADPMVVGAVAWTPVAALLAWESLGHRLPFGRGIAGVLGRPARA